jgi:hypothetical protein
VIFAFFPLIFLKKRVTHSKQDKKLQIYVTVFTLTMKIMFSGHTYPLNRRLPMY